ncbi:PTS system beta-glucoside-specific IIA component, Glc family /PTS system beta-glucoside-specific IIB component, Glc family /PTS system beta-glucoside-specific IIC component, Glc family [Paenibacillus polysaccharolyticus]|uniref:PTS system beta-glucoside-specific IIA component, Glc family /PTS system beta-glucoside-specific IIB component, Glc family /PTS system beta-glucoside-specific IIC component, Glc family n=1 Tax=Paenibacillus polysaccharolyticus TaxID=582692 RepID=A0A1G5B823_9BACL|nr:MULTISPECIES: beta-glucoside-specific PTS transporter subunit IIABC [Paenibacillus]SCX86247.1 PTS system beta-glucoside-specific IIA component, Glc family /PTS system beta-glucoside-specific IIB component, Glc family /PTS system beta-glucoside-specific IIC component, Glc family [Paenibacillus polysaccharolyticus]
MDKQQLSKDILKLVGGEENVDQVTHCMTRLRFNLNDNKKADKETLKNTPGVMGVMENGGQFQVIIGNDVPKVYNALVGNMSKGANAGSSTASTGPKQKRNPISALFDFISGVFTPILPAITGAGMIKGIVAILVAFGWLSDKSSTYVILSAIGDGAFYFLPIILAISAAKKLGSNMYIGAALAAGIMHPTITALLAEGNSSFAGIKVVAATYSSTVIPIVIAIWIASYVEKAVDRITHSSVKLIVVPTVTLLIMVPLTLIAIGPLGSIIGNGMSGGIAWLFDNASILASILIGGTMSLLIITGMHYALLPIVVGSMTTLGYDFIIPLMLAANWAQAGGAIGVGLRSKNGQTKSMAYSTGLTAFMGITEPAMYGVNMRYKKPFIAALIGGAIGGGFMGIVKVKAFVLTGLVGLPGLAAFISPSISTLIYGILGGVIAIVSAALITYILGFQENNAPQAAATSASTETVTSATTTAPAVTEETQAQDEQVFSPITGEVKPLSEVPDPAFSEEIMGKGFAIQPTEGRVVSPINGTVFSLSKSGHAIGLVSDTGAEMLIHIGIDTVKLKGQFFSPKVQAGTKVSVGDVLMEFDREEIEKAGYTTITPVIITNMHQYASIESAGRITVKEQELLFTAKA